MNIAVIGAGRAGTACAVRWRRAGHTIVAVHGRAATPARADEHLPGVPFARDPVAATTGADLVVLAVPDDAIADTASALDLPAGAWAAHLSGALGLSALDGAGGRRLAIHPLQTFPDVRLAIERLDGCSVAVGADDDEGLALGASLARDLGGRPFRLTDDLRPLYHAAAVLGSNDVVALSALAIDAMARAGVPDPGRALAVLQRATVENVETLGPAAALTGPVVRGDAATVEANLTALAAAFPGAVDAYVVLAGAALDLATGAGRLDPASRDAVAEVLDRWT